MRTWFTADTHFNHTNIIKYCNRPFRDAVEMNEVMINNWNTLVAPADLVCHVGDFAFGYSVEAFNKVFNRLNGRIYLVSGNHDALATTHYKRFDAFSDGHPEIEVQGQTITLCHYAMRVWNKSHYGAWHLYGHSHGTLPDDPNSLSFDVGVDVHDFKPWSFEEVKEVMGRKTFKPIDHHKPRNSAPS